MASSRRGPQGLAALATLLRSHKTLVLSGAGISTDSGIPDYRGSTRRPRQPMRYQTFVRDARARQRYWARSVVGWPLTARARPNPAHDALARLERRANVRGVLTQNVDGLHQRSGSRHVLELHGSLATVVCLSCGARSGRDRLQERLHALNPHFAAQAPGIAPDGDVDIAEAWTQRFAVPACRRCGGILKPDVVFFGENVPKDRVARGWAMVDAAEALLVVGSSLTVFSGYRFVRRARQRGVPIAIVNDGPTRGDDDATLRLHARLGEVLPRLADAREATRHAVHMAAWTGAS
ncbi:MAG: NAD-dependent protein deacetylase [Trueperaceae bacterium]|nr:NAD-dependent protein deacetylase [Trueperaceae bacterium]